MFRWMHKLALLAMLSSTIMIAVSGLPDLSFAAAASQKVNVSIDGKALKLNPPAVKTGNVILVPYAPIFQAFGAAALYDKGNFKIIAYKDDSRISLQIGSLQASVGKDDITLDKPAQIINNVPMVSLKFISDAFGLSMKWNIKTNTAELKNPAAKPGEEIYGFGLSFPQTWGGMVKTDDSTDGTTIASKFPLRNGQTFHFWLRGLDDSNSRTSFLNIQLFKDTEAKWKSKNHPGYTYLTSKNNFTLAYNLFYPDPESVKAGFDEDNYGVEGYVNPVSDSELAKLMEIYEQLPSVLSKITIFTKKPAVSTLPSFRGYGGTWTSKEVGDVSLKFIADRAAIVTMKGTVNTVVEVENDGSFWLELGGATLKMSNGKLYLSRAVVSDDGITVTDTETIPFIKKK